MSIDSLLHDAARMTRRAVKNGWMVTVRCDPSDRSVVQEFHPADGPGFKLSRGYLCRGVSVEPTVRGTWPATFDGKSLLRASDVNAAIGKPGRPDMDQADLSQAASLAREAVLSGWDIHVLKYGTLGVQLALVHAGQEYAAMWFSKESTVMAVNFFSQQPAVGRDRADAFRYAVTAGPRSVLGQPAPQRPAHRGGADFLFQVCQQNGAVAVTAVERELWEAHRQIPDVEFSRLYPAGHQHLVSCGLRAAGKAMYETTEPGLSVDEMTRRIAASERFTQRDLGER